MGDENCFFLLTKTKKEEDRRSRGPDRERETFETETKVTSYARAPNGDKFYGYGHLFSSLKSSGSLPSPEKGAQFRIDKMASDHHHEKRT